MSGQNIYLSKPGFICAAGDSSDTDTFIKNLSSGNRDGIKKVDCGLVGEEGVKSFYVGKIDFLLFSYDNFAFAFNNGSKEKWG